MSYTPLKKKIVFSKEVTSSPYYGAVMEVIKSLGDTDFKQWLQNHISCTNQLAPTDDHGDNQILEAYSDLKEVGVILEGLVSREVHVEEDVIESCKGVFLPTPNQPVVSLLKNVMGFLLNMQAFERMIIKIDNDIDNGNIQGVVKHLTRDGNAPIHLPRSMQVVNKYGKKKG